MGVLDIFKKKKKQETVTISNLPPEKKPNVTFVDVGREAPKGSEFVDAQGKSQGNFVRTGGYTIVGGREPGGVPGSKGSSSKVYSTSGEVTSEQAYSIEGGQYASIPKPSQQVKNFNISPEILKEIQNRREIAKSTSQNFRPNKGTQEVYVAPYITRKPDVLKGYTKSGKPVYSKGEAVVIDPFAEQFGKPKERTPTPSELRALEFSEINIKSTNDYNPEDYLSYSDLIKQNQLPAFVRRGAYDFGSLFSKGFKAVGIGKSESSQAYLRRQIGETALFASFSPQFTTTAQYAKILSQPSQVKFVGVSQQIRGRTVKTDVVFQVTKGTSKIKGIASGVAETKMLNVNGKSLYFIKGGSTGAILNKNKISVEAFTTFEKGFGFKAGKDFYYFTKGASGVQPILKNGYSFKYISGSIQRTGKKGITFIRGGTVSEIGGSEFGGVLFPIKKIPYSFIPSKRGQVIIPFLKSTPKKITSLSVSKQASLVVTKTGIEGFATTLPRDFAISRTTTYSSIFKISPIRQRDTRQTLLINKQSSFLKSNLFLKSLIIQKEETPTRSRTIQKPNILTKQQTLQQQVYLQKLETKQILKQKNIIPNKVKVISSPNIRKKILIPPMFFSRANSSRVGKRFNVFVRRQGKFKLIGSFASLENAFAFGRQRTRSTLGVTFNIPEANKQPKNIFGYKTKRSKRGLLFIEKPKFRLSTKTEVRELQLFKIGKRNDTTRI